MRRLTERLNHAVSAILIASLVSGSYGSRAWADQPDARAANSCRLVALDDYIKQHEKNLAADVAPVVRRGIAQHLRTRALELIEKLRKTNQTWNEDIYLQHYADVRQALDAGKTVDVDRYQSPEALLAVFDVSSQRARAEFKVFEGEFSFGALMRNATELQRARMLRSVRAAIDPQGYKIWRAGDALVELVILTNDPTNTLGLLYRRGEGRALRELNKQRLEAQILRRELGSVLNEIGLGRADEPMKDFLVKGYLTARRFAGSIMWTTAAVASVAGHFGIILHSAGAAGRFGGSLASSVPIGDITRTREPLTPDELEKLRYARDLDDLWASAPITDKAAAAVQIHANVVQSVAVTIMTMIYLAILIQDLWQWQKPNLRQKFPHTIDGLSAVIDKATGSVNGKTKAQLEADVYAQWVEQHSVINPDIASTPAADDIRAEIHQASREHLIDVAEGKQSLSDAGMANKMSPEKAAADMHAYSVDKDANGVDNSRYAGLPAFTE